MWKYLQNLHTIQNFLALMYECAFINIVSFIIMSQRKTYVGIIYQASMYFKTVNTQNNHYKLLNIILLFEGFTKVLRIPGVLVASTSIIVTSMSIGFLQATLEPHLRQFNLSPIVLGLMFVINGGTYAITAPAWGWLCDKRVQPKVTFTILISGYSILYPSYSIKIFSSSSSILSALKRRLFLSNFSCPIISRLYRTKRFRTI